ncbi:MAG: hypothetical protein A2106_05290 [Planctomycetes bacterium GWF2_40_8]|nr:MAG: hypothetical protein A2106_05290 [Planctomycetes bacterium GWF2_40_8]
MLKWANKVTKRHTNRVIKNRKIEQLKNKGIPSLMARFIVNVGMIESIRKILLKIRLWHNAKKILFQQ